MANTQPPAPQAPPEKLTTTEIILYLEGHYRDLKWRNEVRAKVNGVVWPQDVRREVIMQTVANSFHYIDRDPEGFKAFCARVKAKWGPTRPKSAPPAEADTHDETTTSETAADHERN